MCHVIDKITVCRSIVLKVSHYNANMMPCNVKNLRIPNQQSLQGGYQYKEAIVNTIIAVIEANPASQDTGLYHLCEFIEDCEHGVLATKILHLLGREGPKTPTPAKFIRYIYNRVILENSTVSGLALIALLGNRIITSD